MSVVAMGMLLLLAGFLLVSAAAKATHPSDAVAALVDVGLPRRVARLSVAAAVAVEAAVAGVMVLWPRATAAQAACVALFGAFALVAAVTLHSGRRVECGCLGALRRSTLGWTQVVQFSVVVPSVILVGRFAPSWSFHTGLGVLFVVEIAAGGLLLAYASPDWWRIRRDRISLGGAQGYERQPGELPALEAKEG